MTTENGLSGGTILEIHDHLNGVQEVASSNLAAPTGRLTRQFPRSFGRSYQSMRVCPRPDDNLHATPPAEAAHTVAARLFPRLRQDTKAAATGRPGLTGGETPFSLLRAR